MRNFSELPRDQEQGSAIKDSKLLKSLLLGLALVIGPSQAKSEDKQQTVAESIEISTPEIIQKVKTKLLELAEGDNSEKRWLAENALREIELNEQVAKELTEERTMDQLPPFYLKGFIKDINVLNDLNEQAIKEFHEFHYKENGEETEEYLKLSVKERIELHHQLLSKYIYSHLVKTDGLGVANLRVLIADGYYQKEKKERAINNLTTIMDIQAGTYEPEYPEWLKSVLKEDKIETEKEGAEVKEITEKEAEEMRELIKSLLIKPKE